MEITFISDTHTKHPFYTHQLQAGGEVIICCGDITSTGTEHELRKFITWYDKLAYRYKILIAGNHDFVFEHTPNLAKRLLKNSSITYLENSGVELEGLLFYGSPLTLNYNNWAFTVHQPQDIKRYWDAIPTQTDVLITHGPPFGILDETSAGWHVGCTKLKAAVHTIKPVIHAFGHVHEAYGTFAHDGTYYINAALVNEKYQPVHAPITINI